MRRNKTGNKLVNLLIAKMNIQVANICVTQKCQTFSAV